MAGHGCHDIAHCRKVNFQGHRFLRESLCPVDAAGWIICEAAARDAEPTSSATVITGAAGWDQDVVIDMAGEGSQHGIGWPLNAF
jgi:hypothetical protein